MKANRVVVCLIVICLIVMTALLTSGRVKASFYVPGAGVSLETSATAK